MFSSHHDRVRKKANVLVGHDELEVGAHVGELYREILALHRDGKNPFQVIDWTVATEREERDLPAFDIGRCKKGKALNMIPMKVSKSDYDRLLPQNGILHDMASEVPYSRPRVDDANIHGVIRSNQDATRTPAVLVELSSAHGN